MVLRSIILVLAVLFASVNSHAAKSSSAGGKKQESKLSFQSHVKPVLSQYCYSCHGEKKKADLDLRIFTDEAMAKTNQAVFEKILKNLESHEMPPENKPQPTPEERAALTTWIQTEVLGCDCNHPNPGRVTIRRLNRAEYNNTIRDLVGVSFQPADDFPADDIGYGFDNIGDVLSLSPTLMEKYVTAAQKIMDAAITVEPIYKGATNHTEAKDFKSTINAELRKNGMRLLTVNGELFTTVAFPTSGEYLLRVTAAGHQAGLEPVILQFHLGDQRLDQVEVRVDSHSPRDYEVRVKADAGEHRVAVAYINNYYNEKEPDPERRDRNAYIGSLEVIGPLQLQPLPETHKRIFAIQPGPRTTNEVALQIIAKFATRAYRRPLQSDEVDRLFNFFQMAQKDGGNFEASVKLALVAVLVSPNFLFRGEMQPDPNSRESIHPIDDFALASRLSYFLWSSMPDDELFKLAERGKLRRNLNSQVRRMLKDPKASALVSNFSEQWLQIRLLDQVSPDPREFPKFNDELRNAMATETGMYFEYVMKEDRSVLEFIDSDYTFVNEPLAQLYRFAGITGKEFRRVTVKGQERGGLLTQASILTVTSNPTRTSPVKRGKWVLDNILGTPPPQPPPNVPSLDTNKKATHAGTMRQRMEQHRSDPACAGCHARMDPIGFGFEKYDAIGALRTRDGDAEIDSAGRLTTGESFHDAADLKKILLKEKRDAFVRCISVKMLTYALGRGMENYDKCAIDQISEELTKNKYKFSSLVNAVVNSTPFQMRRGEEDRTAEVYEAQAKGN